MMAIPSNPARYTVSHPQPLTPYHHNLPLHEPLSSWSAHQPPPPRNLHEPVHDPINVDPEAPFLGAAGSAAARGSKSEDSDSEDEGRKRFVGGFFRGLKRAFRPQWGAAAPPPVLSYPAPGPPPPPMQMAYAPSNHSDYVQQTPRPAPQGWQTPAQNTRGYQTPASRTRAVDQQFYAAPSHRKDESADSSDGTARDSEERYAGTTAVDHGPVQVVASGNLDSPQALLASPKYASDYAKMESVSSHRSIRSLTSVSGRIHQLWRNFNDLPWIADRPTVDYVPGAKKKLPVRTKSRIVPSWYNYQHPAQPPPQLDLIAATTSPPQQQYFPQQQAPPFIPPPVTRSVLDRSLRVQNAATPAPTQPSSPEPQVVQQVTAPRSPGAPAASGPPLYRSPSGNQGGGVFMYDAQMHPRRSEDVRMPPAAYAAPRTPSPAPVIPPIPDSPPLNIPKRGYAATPGPTLTRSIPGRAPSGSSAYRARVSSPNPSHRSHSSNHGHMPASVTMPTASGSHTSPAPAVWPPRYLHGYVPGPYNDNAGPRSASSTTASDVSSTTESTASDPDGTPQRVYYTVPAPGSPGAAGAGYPYPVGGTPAPPS